MKLVERKVGEPGPGEVRIRHKACGLNFIDVYQRTGLYPLQLPTALGMEAAGVVESVGEGVTHLKAGDRAAYASMPPGSYCEARVMPAAQVCPLPDGISFEEGAAMMLKGLTVQYLFRRTTPIAKGDTVLFHAAAGGVGSIVCQWADHLGAEVIGTVGSAEKAEIAKKNGCHHPILYTDVDFAQEVKRITDGRGVDVVYDGVGQATFMDSLDCLRPMGTMVSFGQASGSVPALDIGVLSAKGSLFLTRPSLMAYTAERGDLLAHARDLFDVVQKGAVTITIGQTYDLADAAKAHRELEDRRTTGSTVLLP